MGLSRAEIDAIVAAGLRAHLADPERRDLLLADLPAALVFSLPVKSRAADQLLSDLLRLNDAAPSDGVPPIQVWLANAARLTHGAEPLFSRPAPVAGKPASAPVPPAALRAKLVDGFDRRELTVLVADHFPEIAGGLDAVVAATEPLTYAAHELVEYCRRRGWLERLARAIETR